MQPNPFSMLVSLCVIAFLVFFNAIKHPFVHDDIVFIVTNPQIGHLDSLGNVFFHSSMGLVNGTNAYYRPILEAFYRLEYLFFGFNASGFHSVNVLIHIANGCLIFLLLSRLKFSVWFAYAASLLFLIHPVQTEAVACISGISNLLSTLLMLLTILAYLKEKYIWSIVSFVLALLTKEQVIVVPLLLVLLDWYQGKKNRYALWASFAAMTVGFLILRGHITGAHTVQDILQSPGELRLRVLAIPRTLLMYLRLIVCPFDLHYYRNTDILAANSLGFVVLGSIVALGGWMVNRWKINSREIVFGLAWFVICLLPILNVLPIVNEYSFILTAEHFLYLPMVGVVIVLGLFAKRFITFEKWKVVGIVVCLGLGALSIYQNNFWRGELPLFERMAQFEPNFARGQILLANTYLANKKETQALEHYKIALSIMKSYRQKSMNPQATRFYNGFIRDINSQMAGYFLSQSKLDQALLYYKEALEADPQDVSILNNMAICYLQQGDKIQAEGTLKLALGIDPSYAPARHNLDRLMKSN